MLNPIFERIVGALSDFPELARDLTASSAVWFLGDDAPAIVAALLAEGDHDQMIADERLDRDSPEWCQFLARHRGKPECQTIEAAREELAVSSAEARRLAGRDGEEAALRRELADIDRREAAHLLRLRELRAQISQ